MRSRLFVSSSLLPWIAALCLAQDSQPVRSETPLVRVNVDLVQFDVIVTDAKGTHVPELKPEDFEILDEGKPQRITNFSFIAGGAPVAAVDLHAPAVPAATLAPVHPEDVTRTIAVVIDDLGLSEQSFLSMRTAVQNFVDKQLQHGDLVAIVTTSGRLGSLQRITADHRAIRAAVARLRSTSTHRLGVLDANFESPCFDNDVQTDYYARLSVTALRRIVDRLRDLPGRRSILLFSEGIPVGRLPNPSDRAQGRACITSNTLVPNDALRSEYNAFVLHASHSGVTVNTIDPRGLIASFDTVELDQRQDIKSASPEERHQELVTSQQNLADMARRTGGIAIANDNDLSAAMARVLNEENGYYLIGYRPAEPPAAVPTGEVHLRNIAVRVHLPGAKVRFHSSLYDAAPKPPGSPSERLAAAVQSPFAQPDIRVRCASHFWDAGQKPGMILDTTLHIDARDLTFSTESNGRRKADFDIIAVILGPEIKPLETFEKSYAVSLTEEAYTNALSNGLVQQLELPLKRPGAYQLRSAVRDRQSDRVGSVSELIEVPDLKGGALALSGIVLQHADLPATPATDASVIRFHRGDMIAYSYQVLNAHSERDASVNVQVRAALHHDGVTLGTSEPLPIAAQSQPDPKRIVVTDTFRLGKQLSPGDYTLRITATERRASRKQSTATQSTDFEIVE